MRRFHFPLARLQRVRELGEELARSELLAAEARLHECELLLDAARQDLRAAEEGVARLQSDGALRTGEIIAAQRTLPSLLARVTSRRAEVATAANAVEECRAAWQAARIEVRALERLEDRARDIFREEERANEDKQLAEQVDRKAALAGGAHDVEGDER
jgi:flagellar FliJ protein